MTIDALRDRSRIILVLGERVITQGARQRGSMASRSLSEKSIRSLSPTDLIKRGLRTPFSSAPRFSLAKPKGLITQYEVLRKPCG